MTEWSAPGFGCGRAGAGHWVASEADVEDGAVLSGTSRKQVEQTRRGTGAASACAGADPFDRWLARELAALHADDATRPLPDEMSDLAARLDARLKALRARRGEPPLD